MRRAPPEIAEDVTGWRQELKLQAFSPGKTGPAEAIRGKRAIGSHRPNLHLT